MSIQFLDKKQKKILVHKLDQMTKDWLTFHEMLNIIITDHHQWRFHELPYEQETNL